MSNADDGDKSSLSKRALNRRNMLLGGTTLAAASAITAGNRVAQAQTQQPPAPGDKLMVTGTPACRSARYAIICSHSSVSSAFHTGQDCE